MPPFPMIVTSPPVYPITPANGGTGVASPTTHGVAIAEGSSSFTFITTTNAYPLVGANAADPSFTPTILALTLTDPLSVGSGGTGLSAVAAGNVLVGTGGGGLRAIAVLNPAQGGSGASSLTDHGVVIAHGSGAFSSLISTLSTLNYPVTSQGPANDPIFTNLQGSLALSTPLPVSSGGLGVSAAAQGTILVGTGGGGLRPVAVSTAAYPLRSLGSAFDPDYRILGADGGGTGHTVLPAGAVILGNGTGLQLQYAVPKQSGFVLTDNGPGQLPSFKTSAASSSSSGYKLLGKGTANSSQNITSTSTPGTDITGLSVTCTPDGVHDVKITVSIPDALSSVSGNPWFVALQKAGSVIALSAPYGLGNSVRANASITYIDPLPAASSTIYKVSAYSSTTGTIQTMVDTPNQNLLLVEQVTN